MSNKLEKRLRKEIRGKMSHEFDLLRQIMKPRPKYIPRFFWEWGLKFYFHETIDYVPNKNYGVKMPDVVQ